MAVGAVVAVVAVVAAAAAKAIERRHKWAPARPGTSFDTPASGWRCAWGFGEGPV